MFHSPQKRGLGFSLAGWRIEVVIGSPSGRCWRARWPSHAAIALKSGVAKSQNPGVPAIDAHTNTKTVGGSPAAACPNHKPRRQHAWVAWATFDLCKDAFHKSFTSQPDILHDRGQRRRSEGGSGNVVEAHDGNIVGTRQTGFGQCAPGAFHRN